MKSRNIATFVFSAALPFFASAQQLKALKIVQLDLARQMETPSFISNYIDRVASLGYDTIHFYVEGRIATKSFSLPKGESYSEDEIRGLVAHAAEKGMLSVPCVGLLGHANLFFKYPGLEKINETFGEKPRLGGGNDTFCISKPETREFLRRYVFEVAQLFPGPYFNAGLDEAWNAGVCKLCSPKDKRNELFAETIRFSYETIKAAGKRMWMWDDFFEFYPQALEKTPRDIVMCHWNYHANVSPLGSRGHFAGHAREDWLARYAAMGFESISACWYRNGNAQSLLSYARRHPSFGFMATQWEEMFSRFPNGSLPRVAAISLMLNDPDAYAVRDPYPDAVRKILPSLSPAENAAVVAVYHHDRLNTPAALSALELTLNILCASPLASESVDGDAFSERAILDDIICRARGDLIMGRLAALKAKCSDPKRTAADVKAVHAQLAPLEEAAEKLAARRVKQALLWRKGLDCSNVITRQMTGVKDGIAKLRAIPAAPAPAHERRLVVNLILPEYYGMPKWKVMGRISGVWRELASGIWKPRTDESAAFERTFTFSSPSMPTEIRVEHSGYGRAQLAYVSVDDRFSRIVPEKVLSVSGDVEHAERLLADDLDWADFGTCGFREKFFDAEKAAKVSSVTLLMKPLVID